MDFLDEKDFIDNVLSKIIKDKKQLCAVFATYNEVMDYDDGVVETGKPGLSIVVQNGYNDCLNDNILKAMSIDNAILHRPDVVREMMHAGIKPESATKRVSQMYGRSAQTDVEEKLSESGEVCKHKDMIIFTYAGLSAFDEALDFTISFKEKYPNATSVVLVCDCNIEKKRRKIEPHFGKGVDLVTELRFCGGQGTMKKVLEKLIAIWPEQKAT